MWPIPYIHNEYLSPLQMPACIYHTQDFLPAAVLPRPKEEDNCIMDVKDAGTWDELDIAGC